ncbi:MAG: choice-of-anchor D domain-containing protein [Polyangia bacterium]
MFILSAARRAGAVDPGSSGTNRRGARANPGTLRRPSALLSAAALALCGLVGSAHAAGPKICSLYASTDATVIADVKKKLEDTKLFDSVTNIDAGGSTPTDMMLAACDAVLAWSDLSRGGFSLPTDIGNAMARYIDKGGGLVLVNPYYAGNSFSNVYSTDFDKYVLISPGGMVFTSSSSLGTYDKAHPIMNGINKVVGNGSRCYQRSSAAGSLRAGAKTVAAWSDGNPLVVVGTPNGRMRVDLNLYNISTDVGFNGCYDPTSDAAKLMANALLFVANPVRAQPLDFGEVPVGTTSTALTAEVVNTGTSIVTLTSGDLTPTGVFTITSPSFPVTLKAGEKMTFDVTARPTTAGQYTATYVIQQATMGAPPVYVPLVVRGLGPKFDVQPGTFNFGGLPVGKTAPPMVVTVTNTGGGNLSIDSTPTLTDTTNFALDKVPGPLPMLLSAGASISFEVKFNPTGTDRRYTAEVRIPYSISGGSNIGRVSLTGSYGSPKISVPTSFVMSPVRVNQMGQSQAITVSNSGWADLSISNLSFTGTDAGDFAVLTAASGMAPVKVAPNGGTFDILVQCNPKMQGLRQATLNIDSDDPALAKATVAVQCKGTVANFEQTPDKLEFSPPSQQTGQCTAPKNVTLKNSGTDALKVLSLRFTGTNAASFKHTLGTGTKLVPPNNGTLVIPVQFCPVDIGAQSADLEIATDLTAGHTAKVPLTGTATGPKVVVTPGQIDFGAIYIKATSMSKKVTISNDGDQPLVFGKSTPPPAMGAFKVTGLPADGTTLKKGDAPIVLDVTASPAMAMVQTAEISIVVNDLVKMGVLRIPLSVTGVQADIQVSPMMMTFPVTIIGSTSAEQTLTVTNSGAAPLTGLTVTPSGTAANEYIVKPDNVPMEIPTGGKATFKVAFKPNGNGTRSAILAVNATGLAQPTQVKAEGTGKLLTITCSPDDKNLGPVAVGNMTTLKVTCRNSDPSVIEYVTGFSENLDDWTVDPATGMLPAASGGDEGVVSLQIVFKPTATGPRTTTLTIKTKDGITIGTINLDGTGTQPPKMPMPMDQGCSYSQRAPLASLGSMLVLLASLGTLIARRRRAR